MKPIAIIHWTDEKGEDKDARCYDTAQLKRLIDVLRDKNFMFITYMLTVSHPLPVKRTRRHLRAI